MRVIDLSYPLTPGMPFFPGTPEPTFGTIADLDNQGFRESWFRLTSHLGTHCDAPAHLLPSGISLDKLPAATWIGQGRLLDLRGIAQIGPEHLRPHLPIRCDWLLLRTGWEEHWGKDDYFSGQPELTPAAAQLLAGLGITGIGMDTASPEHVASLELPVHRILLGAGVLVVENLCHLDMLPQQGFTFICAPLPLTDADGAPCRCLAHISIADAACAVPGSRTLEGE